MLFFSIFLVLTTFRILTSLLKSRLLGSFDNFVNAGKSRQFSELIAFTFEEYWKWQHWDQVNNKPGFEVATGYFFAIVNQLLNFIVVGRAEGKHYVQREYEIDRRFYDYPSQVIFVKEGGSERGYYGRNQDNPNSWDSLTEVRRSSISSSKGRLEESNSGHSPLCLVASWFAFLGLSDSKIWII